MLDADPTIRAVHVTSPSYYGFTAPVGEIAAIVHDHGIPLLVDEAHGSHFAFHDTFPPTAINCGADLVVQSPHKTLGSLTQSSLLHAKGALVDRRTVTAALGMLQSSSPSALLTFSLDVALAEMAAHGESLWARTLSLAGDARAEITDMGHLDAYGDEVIGMPGIDRYDRTKLVIDVARLGTTGFAASRWLRDQWQVNPEFADLRRMVFSLTTGDDRERIDLLTTALSALSEQEAVFAAHPSVNSLWPIGVPEMVRSPRASFRSSSAAVPIDQAAGRVAGEMVVPYPPGVPLIVAGEAISAEVIGAIHQLAAAGCRIVGPADATGTTLACASD
jgi:arginine/lysine/ornithine decarboxylase